MNYEPEQHDTCSPVSQNGHYGLIENFARALWIVPAVALLIVVLFLAVGKIELSQTGSDLISALIYSALIALPSMFTVPWVAVRFSKRIPRLAFVIYALVLLCTATVGSLAAAFVLEFVGIIPHGEFLREFRSSYPFCVVITEVIGLGITSFETLRHKLQAATLELRTRQVEQERANKLLAEARLSSLESRIHPHFLFNTLNSIAALIPSDPQRAEDTVGKLASLLRFSLNAHHSGLVPLAQELKIVRDYLEIESTRFGPRLSYEIAIREDLMASQSPAPVAPNAGRELCQACRRSTQRGSRDPDHVLALKPAASVLKSSTTAPAFRSTPSRRSTGSAISSRASNFSSATPAQLEVTREEEQDCRSHVLPGGVIEMPMETAPLRAYLVDDEPLAIERLTAAARKLSRTPHRRHRHRSRTGPDVSLNAQTPANPSTFFSSTFKCRA